MRALVLSGGGARGAYQVGVVKALAESGVRWDMISGISVGALNGTLLAHYGDPKEGIAKLEKFWLDLEGNKSVYKNWWCGLLGSFFYGGAFNTKPLRKLVEDNLDQEKLKNSGVELRIGSVCLETGGYMIVSQSAPNLSKWIMASSAFPVAFPPEKLHDFNFIDGGVRNIVPLREVLEEGATEVDIILASPPDYVPVWDPKKVNNALLVGSRCIDLMSTEILSNDITQSAAKINIHGPSLGMPLQNPLTFDPKEIGAAIDRGYKKTKSKFK